jgi:hypothetical protein
MNTFNRIAGAQAGVDTTRAIMELEARRLAAAVIEQEDAGESANAQMLDNMLAYRRACESYADALDVLADAIRGGK